MSPLARTLIYLGCVFLIAASLLVSLHRKVKSYFYARPVPGAAAMAITVSAAKQVIVYSTLSSSGPTSFVGNLKISNQTGKTLDWVQIRDITFDQFRATGFPAMVGPIGPKSVKTIGFSVPGLHTGNYKQHDVFYDFKFSGENPQSVGYASPLAKRVKSATQR